MTRQIVQASWGAVVAAILYVAPGHAVAQGWSYTRIADTSVLVPGSASPFLLFELPSIRNGTVAFAGFAGTTTGPAGVYTGSGGALSVVADRQTVSPSGALFVGFGLGGAVWPSLDTGEVAFRAGDGIEGGIFRKAGGVITPVATTSTLIPNGGGATFGGTWNPSLENGRVAFVGGHAPVGPQRGVYSWENGSLSVIADITTPIPNGSGTFTNFFDCDLDQGSIVFSAEGSLPHRGLYRADPDGTLSRLYDTSTVVPGGNGGNFTGFARSGLSGDAVVFYGQGGGQEGIYTDIGGTLSVVANHNTPAPGFPGQTFTGFGFVSIDDGVVAFTGLAPSGWLGVFSTHAGTLQRVLTHGDLLDGRIVEDAFIGMQALHGDSIAMQVTFTNGTQGIYMATIPAPAGVLVIGMLGAYAASRRRRR